MPTRQVTLIFTVALAFLLFILFAATSPYWSTGDVVGLSIFGLFFTALVFVLLAVRGNQQVEGHRGLPRSYWVVFASFGAAFALAMLLSIVVMPWVGYEGFDFFFGPNSWWALLVLAAIAFPFVRRHLL
jgi:hypothetical protein